MGFAEVLTLIFVVLKRTGSIDWSWWVVFLPEIIAFGIYAVILFFGGIAIAASSSTVRGVRR
jgi:Transmembrane Fragile-X-F protein